MRTIAPVAVVLALGVAGMMLGMSGFSAAWGADPPSTDAAQRQVNDSASAVDPESGPVEGPVSQTDGSFIGLLASGLGNLIDVVGAVVLLPLTLTNLGFPAWFSVPVGVLAQAIAGIGFIEFAINREWT